MAPAAPDKKYTAKAACFASRVPHYKLNGWARGGHLRKLSVTARAGAWRRYSFEDVAIIAIVGRLTDIGFEIRNAMDWAVFAAKEARHYGRLGKMTVRWYPEQQVISYDVAPIPLPPGDPTLSVAINVDSIFEEVRARLVGSEDLDAGLFDPDETAERTER